MANINNPKHPAALIVIDMTYDFVNPDGAVYYENNRKILPHLIEVINKAREHNYLILFMQHSHRKNKFDKKTLTGRKNSIEGTGGDQLDPSLPINEETDFVIKKRRYSAFYGTDVDLILREHDIRKVVITGTKTNNCVRSTVEDAYHLDYDAIVVEDCVATNDETVNEIYLKDIDRYYGKVIHSKDLFDYVGDE